jgi:hypothetical protein
MAGLDPAIQLLRCFGKRWVPGSSPGMTEFALPRALLAMTAVNA